MNTNEIIRLHNAAISVIKEAMAEYQVQADVCIALATVWGYLDQIVAAAIEERETAPAGDA